MFLRSNWEVGFNFKDILLSIKLRSGRQIDPKKFKEILLSIKLRSGRQRVKEIYVADEAEDNISHEDVFQKFSQRYFQKILMRIFSKKNHWGYFKKTHKNFSKKFSRWCFPEQKYKLIWNRHWEEQL